LYSPGLLVTGQKLIRKKVEVCSPFEFSVALEFDSKKSYEAYKVHSDNVLFCQNWWVEKTREFLELDYIVIHV
jgi:hypothetical protein